MTPGPTIIIQTSASKNNQQSAVICPSAARRACAPVQNNNKKTYCISYVCVSLSTCTPHTAINDGASGEIMEENMLWSTEYQKREKMRNTFQKNRWKPCKIRPFRRKMHEKQQVEKDPHHKQSTQFSRGSEREVVKLLFKKLSKNRDKLLGLAKSSDNTKQNVGEPSTDIARGVITIIKQYFCSQKYDQR